MTTDAPATRPLPPGPDELPVLGSTLSIMRRPLGFVDEIALHGDVVTYHVAGQRFTVLLDPEHIERVLVSDNDRFERWAGDEWGDTFAGYASEGLLLTEGEQWRRQRLLLQNAFTPERIASYTETMAAETRRTIDGWSDGETIDLQDELSALTLRILASALFDVDIEDRGAVVRDAAQALNARGNARNLSAFVPSWVPTPANRRIHRSMQGMEALIDELIDARREQADGRDDLLSVLLTAETEDGTTLSEAEIRDQLITFLFAGHETTALAATYALFALGHHPDARAQLREEVESHLPEDRSALGNSDALPYTDRVITETLRLYPPVYVLFREATTETELGGYRIPAGSKVSMPQFHVHRDERFYEAPERFRPDRWTEAFEADLPDYAYFPFGGGPRHCIGMRFAKLELLYVLPMIVSAVDLEPVGGSDLDFETGITLQPDGRIEARVHKSDRGH